MKLFKKLLTGVAVAAAMVVSAHASIVTIDGISWDPGSTNPADFQASSNSTQWYQSAAAFNPTGPVTAFAGPASLLNTYVTGAGKFNTINGVNNIQGDPNPETTPSTFAPNRELTYEFGGILISNVVGTTFTFDLTNSFFNVYSDPLKNYLESSNLLSDQLNAIDGSLFLTGTFDTFNLFASVLTNGTLAGFADGLISVTGGSAFGNFDTNTQVLGNIAADLTFSGSNQIALGAVKSTVGTTEFVGNTIPEPETLALFGLAILGAGVATRRRIKS